MKLKLSAEANQVFVYFGGFRVIDDEYNIFLDLFVLLSLDQCLLHLVKSNHKELILI